MVGLSQTRTRSVGEFSKGMQRRIGLAQALINDPDLVILDEPTSGLDPITSMEINDLILHMREKYKMSSIIITHDISSAKHTSDRIVALVDGVNRLEGTFDELKETSDPDLEPFFNY